MTRGMIALAAGLLLAGSVAAQPSGMGPGMMAGGGGYGMGGKHMHGGFGPAALDEAAARKAFDSMAATQKSMFDLSLNARKRIDAVLTSAQREQLPREWNPH